jgi:hypothetical protein
MGRMNGTARAQLALDPAPGLRIQLLWTKPSLSVFPNHAAERCVRFSSDMDLAIPSR